MTDLQQLMPQNTECWTDKHTPSLLDFVGLYISERTETSFVYDYQLSQTDRATLYVCRKIISE